MYTVPVTIKKSSINGKGVFAEVPIKNGEIVWKFKPGYDITLNQSKYNALDLHEKERLSHVAYFSPWTKRWVYPPEGDAAEYTDHSPNNNLTVVFDKSVSPEPYFVANRDIVSGEELTNNYLEFDAITQKERPKWVQLS